MRKRGWVWCFMLLLILPGCGAAQKETLTLTRVTLDRGHGSAWGSQFYMDVCADEILQTHYFPADDPGGELAAGGGYPITPEQWDQIVSAVQELEPSLVPARKTFWNKLFHREEMIDGTEFHHLTLCWSDGEGIAYEWPANEQAAALETLLEQLVPAAEAG